MRGLQQHSVLPYLSVVCSATLLGFSGFFVKTLAMPVPAIAGFRVGMPLLLLFLVQRRRLVLDRSLPKTRVLVASGFTALRIALWVLGMMFAPLSKAIVILFLWPIFMCLFGALFMKEPVSRRTKLLLGVSLLGVIILHGEKVLSLHDRETIGLACMLFVALINAGNTIVFKRELARRSRYEVLFFDNLVGAIVFVPFLLAALPSLPLSEIALGMLYGTTVGFLGYTFLYVGLGKIPASLASVLAYIEAVVACIVGVTFFDEPVTWNFLVGGGLIIVSAAMVRRDRVTSEEEAGEAEGA